MTWKRWTVMAAGALAIGVGVFRPWDVWTRATRAEVTRAAPAEPEVVRLVDPVTETIELDDELIDTMEIRVAPLRIAPSTRPLRLNGQLALDPSRLIHVQSRFPGEVVSVRSDPATGRSPAVGDRVHAGQILAEIWSKEVGEKKSDLVDAISNLFLHKSILEKLRKLQDGAVPSRTVEEMQRTYEADLILVTRLRRTLRSWRISEEELSEIDAESRKLHQAALSSEKKGAEIPEIADRERERKWAEIDVVSPSEGIILEKNMTVGDTITEAVDLFKIADMSRLRVMAYVFEEDLPRLLALTPEQRRWRLEWHTSLTGGNAEGEIDTIGHVIDPNQHTAVVGGWLPNPDNQLRIGQFVSAVVEIPSETNAISSPVAALIDQGSRAYVLVAADGHERQFSRRLVKVVRRTRDAVWLAPDSGPDGDSPSQTIRAGERVVVSGAVELHLRLVQLLALAKSRSAMPAASEKLLEGTAPRPESTTTAPQPADKESPPSMPSANP